MSVKTLCSRCGQYRECYCWRVVGPPGHKLCDSGETFEVCSQKCLAEVIQENAKIYGPFQVQQYND